MSDPDLTPEQDDAVRALLAAARHTDPPPPEVVARLDDTLAALRAERLEVPAPVVTLASRRRRLASRALLAAAVVVVGGVGIAQVLPETNSSSDDSSASAGRAPSSAQDDAAGGDREFGDQSERSTTTEKEQQRDTRAPESAPLPSTSALAAPRDLSSEDLKSQLRALRGSAQGSSAYSADPACDVPDAGAGSIVSVTFDGAPAALVYRAPIGATQQVDLFLCGQPVAVRSLRLRAPQ